MKDCGCHLSYNRDDIIFCPLHEAAPELLESLKECVSALRWPPLLDANASMTEQTISKTLILIVKVVARSSDALIKDVEKK